MPLSVYTMKLLALAETLHCWLTVLTGLDRANRERIADYAEAIAATLARAASALARLEQSPQSLVFRADALRELGRISGYVETIVAVLEHHLDGRKIAGVKRRLEHLDVERLADGLATGHPVARVDALEIKARCGQLLAAEGYLRALADGLRA
jgi:hypothetical protein